MPIHQLICLEHAVALGDRDPAFIERQLQRPLRRLAARPSVHLLDQHVVLDVANGQRTVFLQEPHHLAQVRGFYFTEPFMPLAPVQLHRRDEETKILRRHVRQRMRPVFENAFVDALGMMQIRASIIGDAIPEDMMVAALDDVDGIDLHVAEMLDRRCAWPADLRQTGLRNQAVEPPTRSLWRRPCSKLSAYRRSASRSAPIPKFACPRGTVLCELRNQRSTTKIMASSAL